MKFRILFKDADALHLAPDLEDMTRAQRKEALRFADSWMDLGQFIEIEFDTEANTATVVR